MRAMGKGVGGMLAVVACLATPAIAGALRDENLLAPLPDGFVVGSQNRQRTMDMAEFIPKGEKVTDWSRMVTVQVFHGVTTVPPESFATRIGSSWQKACPNAYAGKITDGVEGGYPVTVWMYQCPLNPQTQKPETMWLKAIQGVDALYSVQYAYRSPMDRALIDPAMGYLKSVVVCDPRKPDRPCPPGM